MNFITDMQLRGYESIIKNIEEKFEQNKQLKIRLENENNKIFLKNLQKNMISKLSQIDVKIFRNCLELYNLYDKDIPSYEMLQHYTHCKYYLVEIYLSKLLLKKLHHLDWTILVTITHNKGSQSVVIKGRNRSCIIDVIPIEETVINSTLDANLILTLDNYTNCINLTEIEIDISYHFSTITYNKNEYSRSQKLDNITKLHNINNDIDKYLLPRLDYNLELKVDRKDAIRMLIQNCYHSVDLETFNEIANGSKNIINFTTNFAQQQTCTILFNEQNIMISGSYHDICLLKKFFFKILHNHSVKGDYRKLNNIIVNNLDACDIYSVKDVYEEFRKLWTVLPI